MPARATQLTSQPNLHFDQVSLTGWWKFWMALGLKYLPERKAELCWFSRTFTISLIKVLLKLTLPSFYIIVCRRGTYICILPCVCTDLLVYQQDKQINKFISIVLQTYVFSMSRVFTSWAAISSRRNKGIHLLRNKSSLIQWDNSEKYTKVHARMQGKELLLSYQIFEQQTEIQFLFIHLDTTQEC